MTMRASARPPLADQDGLRRQANSILAQAGLPVCDRLSPAKDDDSANPTVFGESETTRYVIKVVFRHPDTLAGQLRAANWFADHTEIPVPRHLCHATSDADLPLMVMEWMPGRQLRETLPNLPGAAAHELARDWGRCLALLNGAQMPAKYATSTSESLWRYWFEDERYAAAVRAVSDVGRRERWSSSLQRAMVAFLRERRGSADDIRPGVVKADTDLRDFLAVDEPEPRISAVLDWERVGYGYTDYDCIVAFLRLCIMGRAELWPAFCEGYELAGRALEQTAHVEYCLMARGLVAAANGQPVSRVLQALCERSGIPFLMRDWAPGPA